MALPLMLVKMQNKTNSVNKWYTNELYILKQKCLLYYNRYVYCGMTEFKCKYTEAIKLYRNTLRLTKQKYYENLIKSSDNKSKQTWSIISDVVNISKKKPDIIELDVNSINSYFLNKVDEVITNIPAVNSHMNFLQILNKPGLFFKFRHITVEQVYLVILSLKNSSCLDVQYMA